MPKMVGAGAMKDAADSYAALSQSTRQVVVLASPTDELLVVAVHPLVVLTPDADVIADQRRFASVANPAIPERRPMTLAQSHSFGARADPRIVERAIANFVESDAA